MSQRPLVVRAVAGVSAALIGATAMAAVTAPRAGAAPLRRINFAPEGTVVAGWTTDYGQGYDAGRGYGWVHPGTPHPLPLVGNGFASPSGDPVFNTFVHMQAGDFDAALPMIAAEGAWEAAVAPDAYTVTVRVGDRDHLDSEHWINIEGQAGIVAFAPTGADPFDEVTRTVFVADGRLTIDARGGTNTKIVSVAIDTVETGDPAFVRRSSVGNGATAVFLKSDLQVEVETGPGRTVNPATVNAANVRLASMAGGAVAVDSELTGSTITVRPQADLAANTTYRLSISGVQTSDGAAVQPFESVFTTGSAPGAEAAGSSPEVEVAPGRVVVNDVAGAGTRPAGTVVVRNVGGGTLTVDPALTGTGQERWRVADVDLVIPPGVATTIPVEFAPDTSRTYLSTSLTLETNDADEGVVSVPLRGLGTAGTYGELEPSVQWIVDTLGYPINMGDPNPADGALPPGSGLLGEEVAAQLFRSADPARPVTVEAVAAFGPRHVNPVMSLGWYPMSQPDQINPLLAVPEGEAQELLPAVAGALSFDASGETFGFAARSAFAGQDKPVYTQDALNTWDSDPGTPHNFRAYPLRQAGGALVPNAYLFAVEGFAWGDDFQDLMFVAQNLQIASNVSDVAVNPSDLVMSTAVGSSAPAQPVTITNVGSVPLALGTIEATGDQASSFAVTGAPEGPTVVAPGDPVVVSVVFSPGAGGPHHATLRIPTDDPDAATVSVGLHGLATEPGESEPWLAQVVDVLGFAVDVGGTGVLPITPPPPYIGDEIDGALFKTLGAGPVRVTPVARYGAAAAVPFGWYEEGTGSRTLLTTIPSGQSQTLNPAGAQTFSTTGRFGLYVGAGPFTYSEDARNGGGHRMRAYPLKDRDGSVVPGSYLVAIDSEGADGDYQDVVLRVDNVLVDDHTMPSQPGHIAATVRADAIVIDWDDNPEADLAGYRVYRSGALLTPALLTTSTYVDTAAAPGTDYQYVVHAVDTWGNESLPSSIISRRPPLPLAAFSFTPADPAALDLVSFFSGSWGEPATWTWDFDGDGIVDASTPNAQHVYTEPGTYTVTLTVANLTGTDTETKTIVVAAGSPGGGGPGTPPGEPGAPPGGPGTPGPGQPGVACGGADPWAVGMPPVGPTTFHALTPSRILDTRDGKGAPAGMLGAGCTLAVDVTGTNGVPADGVKAVSLNVTSTQATENGYVTVYPCSAGRPNTSSLNTRPGRDIANLVTVPVGADGLVCFYTYRPVHVLADVAGWYGDGSDGSRMTGLAPARVLDTRDGTGAAAQPVAAGGVVSVQVTGWGGVPAAGVSAVVLNVTATESTGPGYLSAFPCDQDVYASALNYVADQTVANHVLVPLDSAGRFCISSYAGTHVVADVLGYYGSPGAPEGAMFTPLSPDRIVDTRGNQPVGATRVDAGGVLPIDLLGHGGVPGGGVDAVMFNLTSADASAAGYLTAFPCGGTPPNASNVNHVAEIAASNLVTVPLGAGGRVCVFSYAGSDVVIDVAGYFSS